MIKLEHISKTFGDTGDGVHAVKDVSLEIGDGEIFGIIGFPARANPRWCAASTCWSGPPAAPSQWTVRS